MMNYLRAAWMRMHRLLRWLWNPRVGQAPTPAEDFAGHLRWLAAAVEEGVVRQSIIVVRVSDEDPVGIWKHVARVTLRRPRRWVQKDAQHIFHLRKALVEEAERMEPEDVGALNETTVRKAEGILRKLGWEGKRWGEW